MAGAQEKIIHSIIYEQPGIEEKILQWQLAEKKSAFSSDSIAGNYYRSFRRTLNKLVQEERILGTTKLLSSHDDLLKYYPYQTRDRRILLLRQKLCPDFVSFIKDKLVYTDFDIDFVSSSEGIEIIKRYHHLWKNLCDKIFDLINIDRNNAFFYIKIFCRINQLFFNGVVSTKQDLLFLKNQLDTIKTENKYLYDFREKFNKIFDDTFQGKISYWKVKSSIRFAVDTPQKGNPELKRNFYEYLLEKYGIDHLTNIVTDLKYYMYGYKSDLLNKAFTENIFTKYTFYSVK